ncbi:carboxypeptidase N subunit 2 [Culex quinquefasciatus]|uniref:Carboxypeptidase N subunit 2 n=1 Tax=Culex quinquefasciatus TaxID=7176 RepID=B0X3R7_CULQU|nr:carboxypeptidase N subunit 2 [Culex quinquefasciatus]|eukprot:XP_001864290.1 carboxypeptidase N subunit 2 [Culex quinquefasciatus]
MPPGWAAIIHDCNHFHNGVYTIRFCAFSNVTVTHDAEEIVFRSEYPRPYFFEFLDSQLTEMPRIMFTLFPEMQNLDVAGSQVENVNKYTFEHAKELRYLNMSGNRLTVLNNFIFKGCDKLVRLDVSSNRISEVKEKALVDAPKLDHLDLSHNLLHELDERLFSQLTLLTYVSLAHNRLQVLHDDLFVNCSMLAYLDLKGNQIEVLSDNFLNNLPFLRTLVVENNKLKSLKIPPQLTKLFASFNKITSVYPENTEKSQLYSLTLSNNNLNSIQNISNLEGLTILDVSFNAIGPLNLTTFLKMKKLTDLNLEATKLNTLEHGLFSQQTKLRRLDISYNFLRTLDITVLTATSNLEKLFIDGNNLVDINYDHIPELFPNLTYLGLFSNVWNCSYLTTLVRFCNRHKIALSTSKSYGEMSHLTNVQGIYCASSDKERIYFRPESAVAHTDDRLNRDEDDQLNLLVANMTSTQYEYKLMLELLDMIRQVNATNRERLDEVRKMALRAEPEGCGEYGAHAAGFQVFIMLILTVILVINVGFMLYVQHNANARRAIDRMILFKRGETASVQTQLEDI